jgi:ABC-type Fe3+ transport system substrate-binding protein
MTGLFTAAACAFALVNGAGAQQIDPKLAKSWEYMQKEMPGVPYSLLADACKEAQVSIYVGTWADAQASQVKAFEERFPCVKVTRLEISMTQLRERFMAEMRAQRYVADLIQDTDAESLDNYYKDGYVADYVISNDKSYGDKLKRKGHWYPLRIGISGIGWNTDLVSEEDAKILTDWKGMIDPRWKGKAGLIDSGGSSANIPIYLWWKVYGDDFIRKMADNVAPRVFTTAPAATQALASGEVSVLFGPGEGFLPPLYLSGAPVRWSLPEPGAGYITAQAVVKNAPHPSAARLYQEYAFTAEGYRAWQMYGGAPARLNYEDPRDFAKEPWYHLPKTYFEADVDLKAVSAKTKQIVNILKAAQKK